MMINGNNNGDQISIQPRKRKIADEMSSNGSSKKKRKIELRLKLATIAESIQEIPIDPESNEAAIIGQSSNGNTDDQPVEEECDIAAVDLEKPFGCLRCIKLFTQKCYLFAHIDRCHKNTVGQDKQIQKKFQGKNARELNWNHTRREETNKIKDSNENKSKQHKCEFCEFAAKKKSLLIRHIRTHTGERPFKCEICARRFTQKSDLKNHMRTHANEFAFQCSICRQGFDLEEAKDSHEKTCICKIFQCDLCKYRTFHKNQFVRHMRSHTDNRPFQCEICARGFLRKDHLKTHMKTHANELAVHLMVCRQGFDLEHAIKSCKKPCDCEIFQCELCQYRTLHKPSLVEHMRAHTGKNAFCCLRCSITFTTKGNLSQHMKRCNAKSKTN